MLIELQRALSPKDIRPENYGICGEPFVVESVAASAITDDREEMGYACASCVEYLGRRSPDRCPSIETYRALLEEYPTPVWASQEEHRREVSALSFEEEDDFYQSCRLFKGFD